MLPTDTSAKNDLPAVLIEANKLGEELTAAVAGR
jgi:hypothetical protein